MHLKINKKTVSIKLTAFVGAPGFEPGTSCTPCKHASRTAPRPDGVIIVAVQKFDNLFGLSFWVILLGYLEKKNIFVEILFLRIGVKCWYEKNSNSLSLCIVFYFFVFLNFFFWKQYFKITLDDFPFRSSIGGVVFNLLV